MPATDPRHSDCVAAPRLFGPVPRRIKSGSMLLQPPPTSSARDAWPPGLLLLGGESTKEIFPSPQRVGYSGDFALYRSGDWLLGRATGGPGESPESAARRLYDDLLRATADHSLARIWNYVPRINAPGPASLENYRAFCRGRALAFRAAFGPDFGPRLPAASAVGVDSDRLAVFFAATPRPVRHFENPRQVPAYAYPSEHGPQSPSFARASAVRTAPDRTTVFISGTAAITGHTTVAPGDTFAQIAPTLENLRAIGRVCGVGEALAADARHFKIYLRHAADYPAVAAALASNLLRSGDHVSYLRSDICRAALSLEIEATLLDAPPVD